MLRMHDKKISDVDGTEHDYLVSQFPATTGFELAIRLASMLGDTMASLFEASDMSETESAEEASETVDMSITAQSIAAGIKTLAVKIQKDGGVKFIKELLAYTERDRKKFLMGITADPDAFTFDSAYTGNYGQLLQALTFILEVNFSSFFVGFSGGDLLRRATEKLAPQS